MMTFEEFKVSKFYRPKVLVEGEESQDPQDMRRMHLEDQKEQYAKYVTQHEPKHATASEEEKRVTLQLDKLRNGGVATNYAVTDEEKVEPPVTLPKLTPLRNNDKSRAEYMRNYRKKPKFCPHCKKQL